MAYLNVNIQGIESAIQRASAIPAEVAQHRRTIRDCLQNLADIDPDPDLSIADTLEAIEHRLPNVANRQLAAVLIRLIGCDTVLPAGFLRKSRRHLVNIIQSGCPDLNKSLSLQQNVQTHEKLERYQTVHFRACEQLNQLLYEFRSLKDLRGSRQPTMKALAHRSTRIYLDAMGFAPAITSITSTFKLVDDAVDSEDRALQNNLLALIETVTEGLAVHDTATFVATDYVIPFLRRVQKVAVHEQERLAEQFSCTISAPARRYEVVKRYPLHWAPSNIEVSIPMTNEGPGVAQDVRACYLTDDDTPEICLGDVQPGPFALRLAVDLTGPLETLELEVEVQWGVVGRASRLVTHFWVIVAGQRTDLDWEQMGERQPYSLEVAYDHDFYGRKDALRRIVRRLTTTPMQSSYITGQKRVGKSSLAHAVEADLGQAARRGEYRVLYLECGEIRHAEGTDTLSAFGERLEEFLADALPRSANWKSGDYGSSLAPLNKLLDLLLSHEASARFVVILDEFDEINESLYRYGELANTFFLNLRTLSSKINLAFVLVGAERMPYVMASQGDKLNKFKRESLDSFAPTTEWHDYCDLVRGPVGDAITFHEQAVRELFALTDGHPYFTKMVCGSVYELAVETKDAEVTELEIQRAAGRVVTSLDTNAFAHYWRDGVQGDAEAVEIASLNRCRVLVAWARTARAQTTQTVSLIARNLHAADLGPTEVGPILEDFARRDIFREQNGKYSPVVTLFATWLTEGGFNRVISDKLGDELAEGRRKREDAAYVRVEEIQEVIARWDSYLGQRIGKEDVRAWLNQVETHTEQRLLFKLVQNVRFIQDTEANEMLKKAHGWLRTKLPVHVRKSRAARRGDVLVTYVDGPGKSGAYYASLYARVNDIRGENVVAPDGVCERSLGMLSGGEMGVVIVDDIIGTGGGLVENIGRVVDALGSTDIGMGIPLSVVVLCGTREGEQRVRDYLEKLMKNADLEVCETLGEQHVAFGGTVGFWETEAERDLAKALVSKLGARIDKNRPLGYGEQALLVTFSRNCPNNTVPILHGTRRGLNSWRPLFRRSKA